MTTESMTSTSEIDTEQTADLAEAREEMAFRARQLFDLTSYARMADMPVNRLAEMEVFSRFVAARDAYLALVLDHECAVAR